MPTNLIPGSQFLQYHLLEQVGAGGFGVVWSAMDEQRNGIVAIKIFFSDPEIQEQLQFQGAEHFISLQHPHVLPTFELGIWKDLRYMISPYIPGGTLEDRLHTRELLAVPEILQYAAEIGSALDYLHAAKIIHRDLKSANILLSSSRHLYLADFDLARVLSNTTQSMHTGRGTPAYSPPEQHTFSAVSPQSDLFSFGIVLYEMFTRQLPWQNEKSLGILQLTSPQQIPDPREINPDLPDGLVTVLRKMTASEPGQRPASAGEALQMLFECFASQPIQISDQASQTQQADVSRLMAHELASFEQNKTGSSLSLTEFAIIDLQYRAAQPSTLSSAELRLMLKLALLYGYQDDYWWNKPALPERLAIANQVIKKNIDLIAERISTHLAKDPEVRTRKLKTPDELPTALLRVALDTHLDELREKTLAMFLETLRQPKQWRKFAFSNQDDQNLGLLAAQPTRAGNLAVRLIGHLRSETAAQAVLKLAPAERHSPIFRQIWETAGTLPAMLPPGLRLKVLGSWLQRTLSAHPFDIAFAFGMAFLGSGLGASLQVYLTYRLPGFLDLERIGISLERGGFIGLVMAFSILVTRLLAERLSWLGDLPRIALAMLCGGVCLNIGLFSFDVLVLKNVPDGLLISVASLVLTLGFSCGNLIPRRGIRMLLAGLTTFTALGGSWWAHTSLSDSPTQMTPIFFYDYTWSNLQILGVVLLVSLPVAILGNFFYLGTKPAPQGPVS